MKWMRLFAVILIGLSLLSSCTDIKDPQFRSIDHFRIKNLGFQQSTIGFNVTYYNPNNFGVTVKEAEANIYMDSVFLGKFSQDSNVTVDKNSVFSIPLSGGVSMQTALQLNLQDLASKDILLKADGSVKVGKAGIYISRPVHYQGVQRLDEIHFKVR
jgi:LEA14-like dessication related protein